MEQQMEDIIDNFKSPNGTILGNKIELNGKKYDPIFIAKNSDMYFSNPLDMTYYPMNDEKNNNLYEKYKKLADANDKVIFGGRLGMYRYFDMHNVIEEALKVAESV